MRDLLQVFWAYFIKPFIWYYRKYILVFMVAMLLLGIANQYGVIRLPFSKSEGIEAMATNTALVLHTKNYQSVLKEIEQTSYANDLMAVSLLQKWKSNLNRLDSLFKGTKDYANLLQKATITSGAQVINSSAADWLFAVEMPDNKLELETLLAAMQPTQLTDNNYRGYTIYSLSYEKGKRFSFAYSNQLLLISASTLLVETGIEQLDEINTSIANTASFERVLTYQPLEAENQLSVYINLETFSLLAGVLTKGQSKMVEKLAQLGSWIGLDSRFLKEGFLLSGKLYPPTATPFLKELAQQTAPTNSNIVQYLPKKTAALVYLGWNNFEKLYEKSHVSGNPNFERYMLSWISSEVALVIQDPIDDKNHFKNDRLVFVKATDTLLARQALTTYGQKYGRFKKGHYQNFDLTELGLNHILAPLFGNGIDPIQDACYTIVDDYVIFANSTTTLRSWVEQYTSGETLDKTAEYAAFVRQIQKESNIYTFISTPRSLKFLKYLARSEWHQYLTDQFSNLQNLQPIGIQCYGMGDHFSVNISISHLKVNKQVKNQSSIAWSFGLDEKAATKAYTLFDASVNQHFILVQDSSRRVYLIDNKGENQWKEPIYLPKFIQSEVFGVDYYSSGELQFVFNTPTSIYVLNKSGRIIKKIDLVAPAKTGMLVTNYGQTPSFFVPCKNGYVYGFDKNGQPLNGWQPNKNVGPIHFPMQYMEYKDKRYLIATSRAGTSKAFDSNGKSLFRKAALGLKLNHWDNDPSIGRIAGGNTDGSIRILNHKGKGFKINALPDMNKNVSFAYADVTGDERKDYIRLQDSTLAIHYYTPQEDKKGRMKETFVPKGIFQLSHKAQVVFGVNMVTQDKDYIGLFNKDQGAIYLYDTAGTLQNGFPLAGTSTFSIVDLFNENRNTVVVTNNNKIYAYKLQ